MADGVTTLGGGWDVPADTAEALLGQLIAGGTVTGEALAAAVAAQFPNRGCAYYPPKRQPQGGGNGPFYALAPGDGWRHDYAAINAIGGTEWELIGFGPGGADTGVSAGVQGGGANGALVNKQLGLLEDDIMYRLSLLAVNVLQPIKDAYPNMVVVGGLRQPNSGIGQHELGEAVDIQIRNQTPEQLFAVATFISLNLNFDQLILNWTDSGDKQGWIHVSFSPTSLRGQVLTKDFSDKFHEGLFLCDPLTGEAAAAALRAQAETDAAIIKELQTQQARTQRLSPPSTTETDAAPTSAEVIGGGAGAGGGVAGSVTIAGFGLDSVTIVSSADVSGWAVTTRINSFGMNPGNMHLEFDKQASWASVDIGGGTLQQATLWVFLKINGQWYCTGAERLRPNQQNKPEDQKFSNWIGKSWLYDYGRWGAMTGYRPAVGEQVGIMVTNGSMRSDSNYQVAERSDVLYVAWPKDGTTALFP